MLMFFAPFTLGLAVSVLGGSPALPAVYVEAPSIVPPEPMREFRGLWIATVQNLDWPSRPGVSVDVQEKELNQLIHKAAQTRLNAVVFQVRAASDAFYPSRYEPWSEWLTGEQGKPPGIGFDPLLTAIRAARLRGMELHAWFNPYRAGFVKGATSFHENHISRLRPDWVHQYGQQLWLDPGLPEVREWITRSILDVVKRYDIDGVHLDDYFYPAPETIPNGSFQEFPDHVAWDRYRKSGGTLGRDDWRRDNINHFISRLYREVKAVKPSVKVGISPRGIWQPNHPTGIQGFNAYKGIYADSRLWLQEGWMDYFSPQLYWSLGKKEQSFQSLLHWWDEQNHQSRHLWPGLATYRLENEWSAKEIIHQIQRTRLRPYPHGHLHFRAKHVVDKTGDLHFSQIRSAVYRDFALIPESPWMSSNPDPPLATELIRSEALPGKLEFIWATQSGQLPRWWLYQARFGQSWQNRLIPGAQNRAHLDLTQHEKLPQYISWRPVDASGRLGKALVLKYQKGAE